jgi:predicted RNA methylase
MLDAGCGAGVVSLAAAHLGARVTAVDRFTEYGDESDNQMGRADDIVARFKRSGPAASRIRVR